MSKNTIRRNQMGIGMMEVLVALMLVALTGLFGASISQLSRKASSYSDNKGQAEALSEIIYNRFKFEATCAQSFGSGSGLGMAITPANATLMAGNFENGWPIRFNIPNLNAGLSMNIDTLDESASDGDRSILPRRLKLERLRLANGVLLSSVAGVSRTYAADIFVQFSEIGGISLKSNNIGSVMITVDDATNLVASCKSVSDSTLQSTCADMGCQYMGGAQPCKCFRSQIVCAAPGYLPVAFSSTGVPDCRAVGGSDCPAGQYLTEFGIDYIGCAPAPVCPAGTSNVGLGGPANPALCKCNLAGETWNGTACAVVSAPTGACGTNTQLAGIPGFDLPTCQMMGPITCSSYSPGPYVSCVPNGANFDVCCTPATPHPQVPMILGGVSLPPGVSCTGGLVSAYTPPMGTGVTGVFPAPPGTTCIESTTSSCTIGGAVGGWPYVCLGTTVHKFYNGTPTVAVHPSITMVKINTSNPNHPSGTFMSWMGEHFPWVGPAVMCPSGTGVAVGYCASGSFSCQIDPSDFVFPTTPKPRCN